MGPNDPWLCFSDGLPIGKVLDLEINYCTQKLLAATFGRGLWEGNLIPNAVENITSSIVWSQPKNLYHNVIVKSGRTLTISASINFGSGIKITVEPNAVLQLSGATLTNACEEMWDGIYAQSGSFIYVTNSTIQNAYKAFNFENNTFYTFTNNTFDKNYISINIGNSTTRSYVTGDISGNIFKCTDNLPRYFGIPVPYTSPDRTSLTSIFVNNADFFALGVNGANQNTIKQMVAGVMSFGSNMTVTNTSFRDIPMSSQYNSYGSNLLSGNIINGSAIFSKGNGAYNLNVSGTNLDFTNCFTGVSVFDQNFTISNCHMDTTTCGILIAMCLNKIGYITNNYIESTERNINLYLNDNVGSINVIGNTLKAGFASNLQVTAHPGAFSIGVWEGHHSASNTRRINLTLNNIEVHYGLFGILLNSSDHVAANDNVISLLHDNNNPQYPGEIVRGFSINDCADASVYGNTVTGTNSSSSSSQYGFELNINSGAPNYLVCNNASNNKRNFYFGGGTSTTQLIGSTIGNGYEGLYIASSGFISQQFHTGNCFSGTYGNPLGAAINNNNLSTVVSASQFLVNPVGCYWPTNNWPGVWFIGDNSQAEFSCTGGGGGGGGGCGGIEPVDVAIVGENFGSSTFNEETQWEGKK